MRVSSMWQPRPDAAPAASAGAGPEASADPEASPGAGPAAGSGEAVPDACRQWSYPVILPTDEGFTLVCVGVGRSAHARS